MTLSSRLSFWTVMPVGRTPRIATSAKATTAMLNAISTMVKPPRYGVPPLGGIPFPGDRLKEELRTRARRLILWQTQSCIVHVLRAHRTSAPSEPVDANDRVIRIVVL